MRCIRHIQPLVLTSIDDSHRASSASNRAANRLSGLINVNAASTDQAKPSTATCSLYSNRRENSPQGIRRLLPRSHLPCSPAAAPCELRARLRRKLQPPSRAAPEIAAIFPLSQVRRGMTGTAWTVFQGTTPEPMQVEILGVLRGARGPGQDMILAQLHGTKAEYTGVVEGMSGSPVYIDGKLLGSLSYRIGQFTKDPIAGITPIEQMLEVRDLSAHETELREATTTTPNAEAPASLLASLGTKGNFDSSGQGNSLPDSSPGSALPRLTQLFSPWTLRWS